MIKMIVCDFDHTLLNTQHQILPENKAIIEQAKLQGLEFCVATGRNAPTAKEILEHAQIKGWLIDLNGGEVVDQTGNVLLQQTLKTEWLDDLLRCCQEENLLVTLYGSEIKYTFRPLKQHYQLYVHIPATNHTPENFPYSRFEKSYRQIHDLADLHEPIFKIEMRSANLEELQRVKQRLQHHSNIVLTSAFSHNLEINSKQCSKASALTFLLNHCGYQPHEVAVFGDDLNDLCLFEQFEHSYAVANAKQEILKLAKVVVASCLEGGVAQGIQTILEENKNEIMNLK